MSVRLEHCRNNRKDLNNLTLFGLLSRWVGSAIGVGARSFVGAWTRVR
jgi:hypothetical protein